MVRYYEIANFLYANGIRYLDAGNDNLSKMEKSPNATESFFLLYKTDSNDFLKLLNLFGGEIASNSLASRLSNYRSGHPSDRSNGSRIGRRNLLQALREPNKGAELISDLQKHIQDIVEWNTKIEFLVRPESRNKTISKAFIDSSATNKDTIDEKITLYKQILQKYLNSIRNTIYSDKHFSSELQKYIVDIAMDEKNPSPEKSIAILLIAALFPDQLENDQDPNLVLLPQYLDKILLNEKAEAEYNPFYEDFLEALQKCEDFALQNVLFKAFSNSSVSMPSALTSKLKNIATRHFSLLQSSKKEDFDQPETATKIAHFIKQRILECGEELTPLVEFYLLSVTSNCLFYSNQYKSAVESYTTLLEKLKKACPKELEPYYGVALTDVVNSIGYTCFLLEEYAKAVTVYNECTFLKEELLDKLPQTNWLWVTLRNKGAALQKNGNLIEAIETYEEICRRVLNTSNSKEFKIFSTTVAAFEHYWDKKYEKVSMDWAYNIRNASLKDKFGIAKLIDCEAYLDFGRIRKPDYQYQLYLYCHLLIYKLLLSSLSRQENDSLLKELNKIRFLESDRAKIVQRDYHWARYLIGGDQKDLFEAHNINELIDNEEASAFKSLFSELFASRKTL